MAVGVPRSFARYHADFYDSKGVARPTDSVPFPERHQGVVALRQRLAALRAPAGRVSAREQLPMLAVLGDRPFSDPEWLFEIKYDGVRVLAERAGPAVELYGRNGQLVTARYPEVAEALRAHPVEHFVLDGEVVALDAGGRPSFQRLQERMHVARPADVARLRESVPVSAVFFDCLALEGHDVRGLPLVERKELLARLLPARGIVSHGGHVVGEGEAFFDVAGRHRLEGIVAKLAASPYRDGRSRDWIKIKCQLRQEFAIGGYTDPQGSRARFGALHLGLYEGGRLVYVSKVGTGFDGARLDEVWARLEALRRATSPFDAGTPAGRGHHWVEPRLVCEVRFTEWTEDGGLRHPTFLGFSDDRRPEDCRREDAALSVSPRPAADAGPAPRVPRPARPRPAPPAGAPRGRGQARAPAGAGSPAATRAAAVPSAPAAGRGRVVKISNPEKVFWPGEGYTKGDLVAYYEAVAPWLLPYLRDRAVVLTRYPDGIEGKSFFQKDAPAFTPAWVRTAPIWSIETRRDIAYFVVDDVEALRYVVNLGTIPLHVWAQRVGTLDRPDWLVLDLDPKGAPFTHVVRVAQALRRILDGLEVPSYVKTSGASGLHILLPLGGRYTDEETRSFARLLAELGVEAEPDIATIARPVHAREDKVYVDFLQNGQGRTIVAPLSVRSLPGAPVSCPLRWPEVTAGLDPGRFTIRTAPRRFEKVGDPMAPVRTGSIDMAAALARMQERLSGGGRIRRRGR
jgi:bifunctional non-homologous end joining protein LigD